MTVAVLFARADSHYKALAGVDVWDAERDARRWPGGCPVVAHPPCRAWGQLRALANPRPDEKALAIYAVEQVRKFGGVLEHPKNSTLWPTLGLPRPGERDEFGGWTLPIYQMWWGTAPKSRRCYTSLAARRPMFLRCHSPWARRTTSADRRAAGETGAGCARATADGGPR